MQNLKRIDDENHEFFDQTLNDVQTGKLSVKEIIGFDLKEPEVYIPKVLCGNVVADSAYCPVMTEENLATSIFSLAPLYNTLVYPVNAYYNKSKMTELSFKKANGISLEEFLTFVHKRRIIPYFSHQYQNYEPDFISHFLEPGTPRISMSHMNLVRLQNYCKLMNYDCNKCKATVKTAEEELPLVKKNVEDPKKDACGDCLSMAYVIGVCKEELIKYNSPRALLCSIGDVITSRNLGAAYKTNCPIARDALGYVAGIQSIEKGFETIVKGLKVSYSSDMDLGSYLDLLDSRTTKAIREIIQKIMEDPFAAKYSERLNARIVDYNREVEEIGKSRMARFYNAVSDVAVVGGSEFVERQTASYLKVGKKDLHKISDWIASKLMDIHAKATGKDWTIAQLYRTRRKLEHCKNVEPDSATRGYLRVELSIMPNR